MEEVLAYSEKGSNLPAIRCDTVQKVIEAYITSPYFLWVFLIFIMNRKKLEKTNYVNITFSLDFEIYR